MEDVLRVEKVIVVGCGGSGSILAEPLIRLLTYHPNSKDCQITFVDGDIYEANNNVRQLFPREALGEYKSKVTAERLSFINPNIKHVVNYINGYHIRRLLTYNGVTDSNSLCLIILTVDNDATRKAIVEALENDFPNLNWLVITPGNSLSHGQVCTYGLLQNKVIGTSPLKLYDNVANPTDDIPKVRMGCQEIAPSFPQLVSTNALAAISTLSIVQNILDNQYIYDEVFFDVYKLKVVPGTKFSLIEG